MMQQVRRNEKESFENLIRRFNRSVQESRVISEAKDRQYHTKPLGKKKLREIAIRSSKIKKIRRNKQFGLTK